MARTGLFVAVALGIAVTAGCGGDRSTSPPAMCGGCALPPICGEAGGACSCGCFDGQRFGDYVCSGGCRVLEPARTDGGVVECPGCSPPPICGEPMDPCACSCRDGERFGGGTCVGGCIAPDDAGPACGPGTTIPCTSPCSGACAMEGACCEGTPVESGPQYYECVSGTWAWVPPSSGGLRCPETAPAEGSSCSPGCPPSFSPCTYYDACPGGQATNAACGDTGWHLETFPCPDACTMYGPGPCAAGAVCVGEYPPAGSPRFSCEPAECAAAPSCECAGSLCGACACVSYDGSLGALVCSCPS